MPHTPEQPREALTVTGSPSTYTPATGDLVWDTSTKRVGEVMDTQWLRYQLRPLGGGIEWHAAAENLLPVTQPHCMECDRIKAGHRDATAGGNRRLAEEWTTAMGRHQRTAHS
ncbi:hypothetical protein ACQEVX_29440 [Streptomyces syringium]|uniref:hypothetical protein n=1 Tax=Streptomyces syringium TaxID=76729 RepID=UPI003D8EFB6A